MEYFDKQAGYISVPFCHMLVVNNKGMMQFTSV